MRRIDRQGSWRREDPAVFVCGSRDAGPMVATIFVRAFFGFAFIRCELTRKVRFGPFAETAQRPIILRIEIASTPIIS